MATTIRNNYLDAGSSNEEDEQGYDSDAAEASKGSRNEQLSTRRAKRRKLNVDLEAHDEDSKGEDGVRFEQAHKFEISNENGVGLDKDSITIGVDGIVDDASQLQKRRRSTAGAKQSVIKSLTPSQLARSQRATKKTGVIYLSRVPPFMKPQTVKHLLSPYGEIGRIFLSPEDPSSHTRRVKMGGNKKRSFTDGWAEFLDKKEAKVVAETLNARIIGGKKGGWYHDDVWNIKYLKGFKWHHLTEQIANENAERAAKLRVDIGRVARENKHFIENVERAKMLESMEAKRQLRRETEGVTDIDKESPKQGTVDTTGKGKRGLRRQFRQNEVKSKFTTGLGSEDQPEDVKRVLGKIF